MKTPIELLRWNVVIGKTDKDITDDINNDLIKTFSVIIDAEEIDFVECIQTKDFLPINKIIFKNGTFIYVAWNWKYICNKLIKNT